MVPGMPVNAVSTEVAAGEGWQMCSRSGWHWQGLLESRRLKTLTSLAPCELPADIDGEAVTVLYRKKTFP